VCLNSRVPAAELRHACRTAPSPHTPAGSSTAAPNFDNRNPPTTDLSAQLDPLSQTNTNTAPSAVSSDHHHIYSDRPTMRSRRPSAQALNVMFRASPRLQRPPNHAWQTFWTKRWRPIVCVSPRHRTSNALPTRSIRFAIAHVCSLIETKSLGWQSERSLVSGLLTHDHTNYKQPLKFISRQPTCEDEGYLALLFITTTPPR